MSRFFSASLLALALWFSAARVGAFSLVGPYAAWQVYEIGYNLPGDGAQQGVMNINEGYRQTVPILTYGFDATFLKYLGTNGVAAVEAAIQMFNDLPAADAMTADLSEFPLKALRINRTAEAAGLVDVKTLTASSLLLQMGLTSAERYVWTIRSRYVPVAEPSAIYSVIQRNWDPITRNPSSFINGELYTYLIIQTHGNPNAWEAVEIPVDPASDGLTTLAGYGGLGGGQVNGNGANIGAGAFFNSLSRDDAGGLRHLYESRNYAVEPLAADVFAGSGVGGAVGGGGTGDAPWLPVTTFTVVTNAAGGGVVTSNTAPRVVTALRPGVGKITFKRVDYDSLLTTTRVPYQITWTDRYVTNGVLRGQQVSRLVTVPDVIFRAVDLGVGPPAPGLGAYTINLINESTLNSTPGNGEVAGPGVMQTSMEIDFGNAGRYLINSAPNGDGVGEQDAFRGFSLGWFDGSTNQPVIFPDGLSVKALEDMVLKGR
jgi:hypothetical protein